MLLWPCLYCISIHQILPCTNNNKRYSTDTVNITRTVCTDQEILRIRIRTVKCQLYCTLLLLYQTAANKKRNKRRNTYAQV